MAHNIDSYKYLWDRSAAGWVLLRSPDLAGGYCIFNEVSSALLHIDDEHLNSLLCQRMQEMGAKTIDEMPKKSPLSAEPRN
jgi:hypothetical protein